MHVTNFWKHNGDALPENCLDMWLSWGPFVVLHMNVFH